MGTITRANEICLPGMCQSVNVAYFCGVLSLYRNWIGIDSRHVLCPAPFSAPPFRWINLLKLKFRGIGWAWINYIEQPTAVNIKRLSKQAIIFSNRGCWLKPLNLPKFLAFAYRSLVNNRKISCNPNNVVSKFVSNFEALDPDGLVWGRIYVHLSWLSC